jgi:hypothetical protein
VQPAEVVTATLTVLPVAGPDAVVGAMAYVQGSGAPDCSTFTVWSATVTMADRSIVSELGATSSLTVPAPLPDAPLATLIQVAAVEAVHAQPTVVSTADVTDPPPAATRWSAGLTE